MGDGDGWIRCARGHRHWGLYGAAGLLLRDGDERWVLQHRAEWTHEGGTWGIPGGARDSHESAIATALREAQEEAAIDPEAVRPTGLLVDDHGGWSYTTVVADVVGAVSPRAANAESNDIVWCSREEVQSLPLHSGFSTTWPRLRDCGPGLVLVIDADMWINAQRDGVDQAWGRLLDLMERLRASGLASDDLPTSSFEKSPLSRHFPRLVLVAAEESARCRLADRAAERAIPIYVSDHAASDLGVKEPSGHGGLDKHIVRADSQWLDRIHIQHTVTSR